MFGEKMNVCQVCGNEVEADAGVCPQCGAKVHDTVGASSGASSGSGRLAPWVLRLVIASVVAVGIWSFYRDAFRDYHPVIAKQPDITAPGPAEKTASTMVTARVEGPFMIVPLSEVQKYRIVRFLDPEGKQKVPVLAYITPGGKVVTAMSQSENCRSQDFYLDGDNIHCASCPSYWNASSLEAYACCQKYYPDPIPSTLLGDEVRIETANVRGWQPRS
ncbi:MAG: hypothetical protein A2X67_00705 [Ignavibacteria bacterium GWA2_55_11]|nr:MAG: hypothetical protein A2X67_00705 [Ignavibacteria bacterium GWA2_55_11]OGU44632.1 MAG: hypothetical protein A2X68_10875 [Ignavibacteria bacterium GWC2_56_12]OGU62903.1 MAG: hypothetical protein A3C56_02750 [Ignavibacteria bacterium RIFCSPHIGHO2_02_FULL_56_12]OGU68996.1 MAG: hypothetical protein A3H45_15630 [Ignavibacteria bacterium RIFCSPLOWO2_02_FULL_55_14]OGU76146.1 MAG: hypothetical protein A3G43_06560 [Ignavibacteria bacterium RIFCSPLOWO2_12_FULL_56_21]